MTEDQKSEALELAKAMGGGPVTAAKGDTEYVVQVRRDVIQLMDDGHGNAAPADRMEAWQDIATVTVPHRTPRKIVFRQALKQADLKPTPDAEPLRLRALDAASAADTVVPAVQPDPEWVI